MTLGEDYRLRKTVFGTFVLERRYTHMVDLAGSGYYDEVEKWRNANLAEAMDFAIRTDIKIV